MAITFSSGGVSRTPSSRSNCRAPLGQRSTTVVMESGSALSGCIQGRFSASNTSGKPLTHSLAWMQRCRSNETVIFSERYAFLPMAHLRLILPRAPARGFAPLRAVASTLHGEAGLDPALLASRVVEDVPVAHLLQLPGLFPRGFALLVHAVYDDLGALVGQHLLRLIHELVREVDRARQVAAFVVSPRERLHEDEVIPSIHLGLQLLPGDLLDHGSLLFPYRPRLGTKRPLTAPLPPRRPTASRGRWDRRAGGR